MVEGLYGEINKIKEQITSFSPATHDMKKVKVANIREKNYLRLKEKYNETGEFSKEQWKANACKDCKMSENNWHTKSRWPKYGLHLWVHHTNGYNGKRVYERGFTIVKDPRFVDENNERWSLRVELIPKRDKKRNTRGFVVSKNEYGREEWYASFYERMKKNGCTLKSYDEVLDENKKGKWREHPMRIQRNRGKIISVPLRFDLNKDEWRNLPKRGFAGVKITRRLRRNNKKNNAKVVLWTANHNGVFKVCTDELRKFRQVEQYKESEGEDTYYMN